jgi:hypothetical protein
MPTEADENTNKNKNQIANDNAYGSNPINRNTSVR